jgi:hypothetical protein
MRCARLGQRTHGKVLDIEKHVEALGAQEQLDELREVGAARAAVAEEHVVGLLGGSGRGARGGDAQNARRR